MKKQLLTVLLAHIGLAAISQPCAPNTNSLQFNGTTSYVAVANQTGLDITDSITIEAWVNAAQFGITSAQNSIVCSHGWSQGEEGYVLRLGGTGQLSFNFGGLDVNGVPVSWVDNISAASSLTLNTWYHVAATFDGAQSKIYINGVLKGTTPFNGTIANTGAYPLNIGHLADAGQPADRYFNGKMDEIRIWHRALSQTDIQANMSQHLDTALVTGLVAYWRMNNGTGTTVADLSGNGYTGTTTNITWSTVVPFNSAPPAPGMTFSSGTLFSNATSGNQWYLNGSPISGATGTSYVPVQNGSYSVVVTNAAGCTASSSSYNVTTVGINEVNGVSGVMVSSMASQNAILFTLEANKAVEVSIVVYDVSGKMVTQMNNGEIRVGKNTLHLIHNGLVKGMYLYEIKTAGSVMAKGKFVVN